MLPTLKPGQEVLVWCWFLNPQEGDIVAIKVNGKKMIKRIQSCNGRSIFVIGDNKERSSDSRKFGWIKKDQIIGKIIWY